MTIGTFFRIISPLPFTNNMRGDVALVKTQNPMIFMRQPHTLPTVCINKQISEQNEISEQNSLGFVLNNVLININRSTPLQTTYSGLLCDKQRRGDWN